MDSSPVLPSPATLRRRLSQDPESGRPTSARLLVPDALGVEESKAGSQPRRGATAGANANGTATVTYTVSDGTTTDTGALVITITAVPL